MDKQPTKHPWGPLWWIPAFWNAERDAAIMVLVFLTVAAAMFCAFLYGVRLSANE